LLLPAHKVRRITKTKQNNASVDQLFWRWSTLEVMLNVVPPTSEKVVEMKMEVMMVVAVVIMVIVAATAIPMSMAVVITYALT